jgi:hypothetical protein
MLIDQNDRFYVSTILDVITIIVLWRTWRAANRQAKAATEQSKAATKLTEATDRQIQTSQEQAQAAREQVEVARRQITESLRPIISSIQTGPMPQLGSTRPVPHLVDVLIENEGAGPALDVWWQYGSLCSNTSDAQRYRIGSDVIAPKAKRSLRIDGVQAMASKAIVIVYKSLGGIMCATEVRWEGPGQGLTYHPDVSEWAAKQTSPLLAPL